MKTNLIPYPFTAGRETNPTGQNEFKMKNILILLIVIPAHLLHSQTVEVSSTFIDDAYAYAMRSEEKIRKLHCEIHDYNSLLNKEVARKDSVTALLRESSRRVKELEKDLSQMLRELSRVQSENKRMKAEQPAKLEQLNQSLKNWKIMTYTSFLVIIAISLVIIVTTDNMTRKYFNSKNN